MLPTTKLFQLAGKDFPDCASDAKAFAQDVELCDTAYKLESLVRQNATFTAELATKRPKWHAKLIALIEKQRDAVAAVEAEIVDEDPARNLAAG